MSRFLLPCTMVPVVVVTGFLGSGKTSLIAHLLDSIPERKIGVVVNDIGTVGIDTAYLHGGEHTEMRSGGLLRSVSGGTLAEERVRKVIGEIVDLCETEQAEIVVLETSGASDLHALLPALQNPPIENGGERVFVLRSVITMVDTYTFADISTDEELKTLLDSQLFAADLVVLNKWDRAPFFRRRRVLRRVRNTSIPATIARCVFGRLPVEEILAERRGEGERSETSRPATPYTAVTTTTALDIESYHLDAAKPFHPQRLEGWLQAEWPGLLRVKGFVWLASDMTGVYVIDAAGPQREVGLEGTWYAALPEDEIPRDPEIRAAATTEPWGDRRQSLTLIGTTRAVSEARWILEEALLTKEEILDGPDAWRRLPDPITPKFEE